MFDIKKTVSYELRLFGSENALLKVEVAPTCMTMVIKLDSSFSRLALHFKEEEQDQVVSLVEFLLRWQENHKPETFLFKILTQTEVLFDFSGFTGRT